jgi:hypothetical protein
MKGRRRGLLLHMNTTLMHLLGRLCGRETTKPAGRTVQRPVAVEAFEGRVMMSGDAGAVGVKYTSEPPSILIALLLPAVQKVREAASTSITDGTSNTILVAESYQASPTSFQLISAGTKG